jgi:four helix bundle protein
MGKGIKMNEKTFKTRTKKLAVAIIKQMNKLPNSRAADVVARQVIRSGTSIGANYRALMPRQIHARYDQQNEDR